MAYPAWGSLAENHFGLSSMWVPGKIVLAYPALEILGNVVLVRPAWGFVGNIILADPAWECRYGQSSVGESGQPFATRELGSYIRTGL